MEKGNIMNFFQLLQLIKEDSPDTIKGSFTEDLIQSKEWLCKELKNYIKGKPNIYILGSWYGNLLPLLKRHKINYSHINFVEISKDKLDKSKELVGDGNFTFINQDANKIDYSKADLVINTSSNEMNKMWLNKVSPNTLVVIQARNKSNNPKIKTNNLEEFDNTFPLKKTLYIGKKDFEDPETKYLRFMKIGKT